MTYSFAQIKNVAECDNLIESAQMERAEIAFRKQQQERQHVGISNGTVGVEVELAAIAVEITTVEAVVASMPEGSVKKSYQARLTKLNFKKFTLEQRRDQYGIFALLEKEFQINCIEQELVVNSAYVAALEARKLEL